MGRCDIGDDEKIEEAELDEISKLQKELSEFDKQRTFSNKKDVEYYNKLIKYKKFNVHICLSGFKNLDN